MGGDCKILKMIVYADVDISCDVPWSGSFNALVESVTKCGKLKYEPSDILTSYTINYVHGKLKADPYFIRND